MASNLTDWAFSTSETDFKCAQIPFGCDPPRSACTRDPSTARTFCCDYKGVCWNDIATCATDGSTFTCQHGSSSWCCITGKYVSALDPYTT